MCVWLIPTACLPLCDGCFASFHTHSIMLLCNFSPTSALFTFVTKWLCYQDYIIPLTTHFYKTGSTDPVAYGDHWNQGCIIIWVLFPNLCCKLCIKAVHFSTHIIIQKRQLKPACPTPTDRFTRQTQSYISNKTINMNLFTHSLLCAHVHSCSHTALADMFFPLLRVGGMWLPHGSWTPEHLSLNNLHPMSLLNNSETLLIFCKIMVVILRWKRSRVG